MRFVRLADRDAERAEAEAARMTAAAERIDQRVRPASRGARPVTAAHLPRIERLNYLIGGVLVIVCALTVTHRAQALGAAVGVALTCLNFAFMNRLIGRWLEDAKRGDGVGSSRIALIMPKMAGLMGRWSRAWPSCRSIRSSS
jgi:hypothetical protein